MDERYIDALVAGREMDALVIKFVFALPLQLGSALIPNFSTDWASAGKVIDRVEELVARFQTADGFVRLDCGHFADHGECVDECDSNDAELDSQPYSFHLHLGLLGENDITPKHWKGEEYFCARGSTGPEAISRAVLKAFDPDFVRERPETHEKVLPIIQQRLNDYTARELRED